MKKDKMKKTNLIIDSLNLFTRHYIAHPAVSSHGDQVGGLVGFLYNMSDYIEKYRPHRVVVVWESGGSPRRRAILKEYKNKRKPQKLNRFYSDIPDTVTNRNNQVEWIVSVLHETPVLQMYVPDCEADDVISYMCKYNFREDENIIISSDKDYYQLIKEDVKVYSPTWKKEVGVNEVLEKFKIHPNNFCLAKSIAGDESDNISGVSRVSFKTIAKRFPEFGSEEEVELEDLIKKCQNHLNEGRKLAIYKNMVDQVDVIKRNRKLICFDNIMLAHSQVKKINYLIDSFEPKPSKINVLRKLLKINVDNFSVDRLFSSFKFMREQ